MQEESLEYVPQYIREALARLGTETHISIGAESYLVPRHLLPNELEWRTSVLTWCVERIIHAVSGSPNPETLLQSASHEVRCIAGLNDHELNAVTEIVKRRLAAEVGETANAQSVRSPLLRLRALASLHYEDAWRDLTQRYKAMLTQEGAPHPYTFNC